MSKKLTLGLVAAVMLVATTLVPPATQAQICRPDENGRLADARYEGSGITWDPVVEFREMVLTIAGPCEDIVKVFEKGKQILFDIREIERVVDGDYTWQLRRVATIDPGVEKTLAEARGTSEEQDVWWNLFQKGAIPDGPYVESGSFTVERGQIVDPNSGEEKSASLTRRTSGGRSAEAMLAGALGSGEPAGESGGNVLATKDTVLTNSNGVIRNSLCVGFDCANNNTYSDTTIMLTENNTRIKFDDTSSLNSFPRNDWEIEANSSSNGGQSYLGFNDCGQSSGGGCATDLVFAVESGVRQNALYVESDGDVGVGTANPVVRMHLIDGDTPALRLEQDGSSGFAPQVWDVAGNETNFFVRDATGGSQLPFRIQPGADSNAIFIANDNDIGMGTSSPDASLDVRRSGSGASIQGTSFSSNAADAPQTILRRARGTSASPTAVGNADNLGVISFRGHTGTTFSGSRALITAQTTESWSGSANGSQLLFSTTANGTTSPVVRFEIRQNGDIFANGALAHASSRELKENFAHPDPQEILQRVVDLPVTYWNYRKDEPSLRHIGPTAEDFYAAFQVGNDQRSIAVNDSLGVALAAIKGLYETLEGRDLEIAELKTRLAALEERQAE